VTKDYFSMPFAAPLAVRAIALALGASLAFAGAALAETKPAADKKTDAAAAKPELVGSYGDWSVFHSLSGKTLATRSSPSGRAKACATKCR
jgi:hypothetical protein